MQAETASSPMRRARIRLGLTLAQVAEKCTEKGVSLSEGQASRIERGVYAGRPETRVALAEVLGLDAYADFEVTASAPRPSDSPAGPADAGPGTSPSAPTAGAAAAPDRAAS